MLEKFRAQSLPKPPANLDWEVQEYLTQVFRVLETYFSQLDSLAPNQADSYRADAFYLKDSSDIYWKLVIGLDGTISWEPQRDSNTEFSYEFSTEFA